MGSLIAQNFCIKFPDKVNSLILCSGYCSCSDELHDIFMELEKITSQRGVSGFFDRMIKLVYTPEYLLKHQEYYKFKKQSLEMNTKEAIIQSIRLCRNFDIKKDLSQIEVPSLLLRRCQDSLIPLTDFNELNQNIKNSRRVMLQNTGHNIFLKENISRISFEIEHFLK